MSYIDQTHLWGAYDANMIAADELNGPGVHWWVDVLEQAEGEEVFTPLVMNNLVDMWADPDTTIRGENREIEVRREPRVFLAR